MTQEQNLKVPPLLVRADPLGRGKFPKLARVLFYDVINRYFYYECIEVKYKESVKQYLGIEEKTTEEITQFPDDPQ